LQVEKDEHYIRAVVALCAGAEEVVKENNAIDIYEQYWEGDDAKYSTEAAAAHTLTQLLDPSPSRRGAQYLCWHPDGSRKVLPSILFLPASLAISWISRACMQQTLLSRDQC
jgi:dynein intermediate chain 2